MRHFTITLLFALAALVAGGTPITLPVPAQMPELPSLPPLSTLQSRTPVEFSTYSSGSGSYQNNGGSRLSEPGHTAESQWSHAGNWNNSTASGYNVDFSSFSIFAGEYSWSDWSNMFSNFDEYYTPIGSLNYTVGGGNYGWDELGLSVNVSSDYRKVRFSVSGFDNSGAGDYSYQCAGATVMGMPMRVCDNPPGSYTETRTPLEGGFTISFPAFIRLYYGSSKPVPGGMTPEQATAIAYTVSPTSSVGGGVNTDITSSAAVPEPTTLAYATLAAGLIIFAQLRRKLLSA